MDGHGADAPDLLLKTKRPARGLHGVVPMRIKLASVLVENQSNALAFYTGILGFVKKQDFPKGDARFLTVVSPEAPDEAELILEANHNPAAPAKAFQKARFAAGIPAMAFEVKDVRREFERLQRLGVAFAQQPLEAGPLTTAVLDDTCGNLIQIYQRK